MIDFDYFLFTLCNHINFQLLPTYWPFFISHPSPLLTSAFSGALRPEASPSTAVKLEAQGPNEARQPESHQQQ